MPLSKAKHIITTAVAIRPDGHIAWIGDDSDRGPRRARHLVRASGTGHHGIATFSQRVNVPVGPFGPSSATRTTSREPASIDSDPS